MATAKLQNGKAEAKIPGSKPGSRKVAKKRRKLTIAERKTVEGRFAVHLRALMDAKKWQVGDLHEQLELFAPGAVDKPAIQAWLRGQSMPKAKLIEPIGKALGLSDYRQVLPPPTA